MGAPHHDGERDEKHGAVEDMVVSSSQEEKERKVFMQDLNRFMGDCGKPLNKIPIMGYKELDLFQLFREVMTYGGFNEVVKNVGTWSKIWKKLGNFDPSITDSSFRLKKNYERYLLEYEYYTYPEHRKAAVEVEKIKKPKGMSSDSSSESKSKSDRMKIKKYKRKSYSSYQDVARDKSGQPKLPIILGGGELVIENFGNVIPRTPYITEKHIWPIGFTSSRYFSSMINPDLRVKYTSQIVDDGTKPQFIVTAADDPEHPIISHSPSGAWRTVLKRVMGKGISEDSKKNISVSGTLRFGLAHPVVSHLIRELPGANLVPQFDSDSSSEKKGKKRKSDSDREVDSSPESLESPSDSSISSGPSSPEVSPKIQRRDHENFSARDVLFTTREELDDLESAVATLQALKYCTVF